jgi:hypothetical protein
MPVGQDPPMFIKKISLTSRGTAIGMEEAFILFALNAPMLGDCTICWETLLKFASMGMDETSTLKVIIITIDYMTLRGI